MFSFIINWAEYVCVNRQIFLCTSPQKYVTSTLPVRSSSSSGRFSPGETASNTLCLEAFHCRIFIQINDQHSLLPSSSAKEDSCLVAHDVVSVAECFLTFQWNIKSDRKCWNVIKSPNVLYTCHGYSVSLCELLVSWNVLVEYI